MVHGRKGFERIEWAFKNVLNDAVVWAFVDLNAINGLTPEKLGKFDFHIQLMNL